MSPVMVVAETGTQEQTFARVGELVRTARQINLPADGPGPGKGAVQVILSGPGVRDRAGEVAGYFGLDVFALDLPGTGSWDLLKAGLLDFLGKRACGMVLFAHTTMAREVAPALAVRFGGVCVSNVTAVRKRGGAFIFTRPVMDNTRIQDVQVDRERFSVLSLAPGVSVETGKESGEDEDRGRTRHTAPGSVTPIKLLKPDSSGLTRKALLCREGGGDRGLDRAPVVVAAGRGIGDLENLDKVRAFTACFPKAAMAASRPLVDQGWVCYDRQVGITGAVVSPDLYIALGISGSSQHLAGMAGSRWVVGVNKNPDAPIFRNSDLCIQADIIEFIDIFLKNK